LIAAIVPHSERTWFFVLKGPVPAVEEQKEAFDRLLASVRFTSQAGAAVDWTTPEGWKREPGSGMRYATLRPEGKDRSAEVTVTALGREAADVLPNVNRWRGQIGLGPVSEAELAKVSTPGKVGDAPATVVDMTGPGGSAAPSRPLAPPAPAAEAHPSLRYAKPAGWTESANRGMMSLATFEARDGDKVAKVTVIPLAGQAGGLVANVNRWRGQIGLGPASEEEIRKDLRTLDVAGVSASYVDLTGPETAGAPRKRILAVSVPRGPQTWFLKMEGPADLVGREKPAFEAFARSVQF
jgi:hypothetical protein